MQKYMDILLKVQLFAEIKEQDLSGLLTCLNVQIKKFEKDEFIFISGTEVSFVGIVLSGGAEIIKEDYAGNRSILSVLGPTEIFGEVMACANIKNSPVSAVANNQTTILLVDYSKIVNRCSNSCQFHNQLIFNMLKLMAQKSILLSKKIDYLSLKSLRGKISSYLLEQSTINKSLSFTIPLDRSKLSDFLNTDRSALSRELSRMRDEKLIEFNKNFFTILDDSSLQI